MNKKIVLLFAPLFLFALARADSLQVRHDHDPWGQCQGELLIGDEGIEYRSQEKEHNRRWKWVDIQTFDRRSPAEFSILTYEDHAWYRARQDRQFDFTVLPEAEPLPEEAFQLISELLGKPVTDRMAGRAELEYEVGVKHLHTFGGCEGTLIFGKRWIVYQSENERDTRTWKRDRDVESVWSLNRYQLEIKVFEENKRAFDKTRRFRFQLKEPLDEGYYQELRREFLLEG